MAFDVQRALEAKKQAFIETRTQNEMEINKFLRSLESWPDEYFNLLKLERGKTARDLVPSMWSEPFNIENYNMEMARLTNYINSVSSLADKIANKAMEELGCK